MKGGRPTHSMWVIKCCSARKEYLQDTGVSQRTGVCNPRGRDDDKNVPKDVMPHEG